MSRWISPACFSQEEERLAGAGGGEGGVALGLQSAASQAPNGLFVLDDEDRLGSAGRSRVHRRPEVRLRGVLHPWKIDLERRAQAGLAVDRHVAPALLHDSIDRRETEAGPFSGLLRREERLEDVA